MKTVKFSAPTDYVYCEALKCNTNYGITVFEIFIDGKKIRTVKLCEKCIKKERDGAVGAWAEALDKAIMEQNNGG